jgi:hypothetical protein
VGKKGVLKRAGGSSEKKLTSDRYKISARRGIQWDRSQIRVSGRGSGPHEKKA